MQNRSVVMMTMTVAAPVVDPAPAVVAVAAVLVVEEGEGEDGAAAQTAGPVEASEVVARPAGVDGVEEASADLRCSCGNRVRICIRRFSGGENASKIHLVYWETIGTNSIASTLMHWSFPMPPPRSRPIPSA